MGNWFKLQTWKDLIARVKARFSKAPITTVIEEPQPQNEVKKVSKSQGNKQNKSIRLTEAQANQLQNAVNSLRDHYGDLLSSRHLLTPRQKEVILSNSPILSGLKNLTELVRY